MSAASPALALVTGTTSGIGLAVAKALLGRGWEVVGLARREAAVAHAHYRHVRVDLGDLNALAATTERDLVPVLQDGLWRRVGLVNNAATPGPLRPLEAVDPAALARVYTLNTAAPAGLMGAVLRHTPAAARIRIVNVSSGAAVRPIPGSGTYNVAKAGLEMLTSVIAAEQRASGITAITIRPGIIDTPMQAFLRAQSEERLPAVGMFRGFHESSQLVPPDVTAAKIVERLVLGPVESGRTYSYAEL